MAGVFFAKAQGLASPQEKPGLVRAGLEASTAGECAMLMSVDGSRLSPH
jgi:hypothetical protein